MNQTIRLTLLACLVFLVSLLNAAASSGLTVWHLQLMPMNVRPRFLALMTTTVGLLTVAATLSASLIEDRFKAVGWELNGLLILRAAALCFAAADIFLLSRIKEFPYKQERWRLHELLIRPFREKKYLLTVALACVWFFTANIPGSYYTVYLLRDLHVSYSFITLVSMLNIPALIFLVPVWRRRVERHSWFAVLGCALGLYALHMIGLAFVTGSTVHVLYPLVILYSYVMAVGINLAFANVPYINIPEKNQTVFISFYFTMSNLAAVFGAITGRFFVTQTDGKQLSFLGTSLSNKQVLVLFVAGLMIIGSGVILLVHHDTRPIKPEARKGFSGQDRA